MHRIFIAAWLALCATSLFASRAVRAGTAVRLDVAGLTDRAELIVEARVVAQRALLAASGRIETEYELDVARTFEGESLPTRTIRLPGGVLSAHQGGRGLVIPGMPQLATGERVVLFLTPDDGHGMRMPVGLAQGKYRILTDAQGRAFAVQALGSLSLVDARGAPVTPAADARPLDEFVASLQAAVDAKHARLALPGSAKEVR